MLRHTFVLCQIEKFSVYVDKDKEKRNTIYVRPKYIQVIREYILAKPDYKDTLKEIKANVLLIGATEEEFNEAIKQLGAPAKYSNLNNNYVEEHYSEKETKKSNLFKRLIELDVAAHVVIAILLFFFLIFLVSYSSLTNSLFNLFNKSTDTNNKNGLNIVKSIFPANLLNLKTYANQKEVDAKKIFSFPKSNITLKISGTPKKEVMGFLPYWMLEKASEINLDTITSVSIFGLDVDESGNILIVGSDGKDNSGWLMWNDKKLNEFITRAKRKRIKIYLTFKSFNNENIEKLVTSDKAQKTFIANSIYLINSKNLDGINIDFEYVGTAKENISSSFTRFITNLNTELKRQLPKAVLTIDTYITSAASPSFFDVELLSNQSDALVVMGYDIHTPQGEAGSIAPMNGEGYTIIGLMQSYLEKVSPEKLILAVPYYGYDWPVDKSSNLATAILAYAELAELTKDNTIHWNEATQTPWYEYLDLESKVKREVHFENTRSLGIKYDFINKKDIKGVGIWALGYDGLNTDLQQLLIDKFAN